MVFCKEEIFSPSPAASLVSRALSLASGLLPMMHLVAHPVGLEGPRAVAQSLFRSEKLLAQIRERLS